MNKNFLPSVIIAIGCFLFFFLVLPGYSAVSQTRSDLASIQDMVAKRQAEQTNFRALLKEFKARSSEVNRVLTSLPRSKHLDEVVSGIESAASQSGLQLVSLSSASDNESSSAQNYKKMIIDLSLSGSYTSFVTFVENLEQSLRIYDVFDITLSKDSAVQSGNILNLQLKLNAYNIE